MNARPLNVNGLREELLAKVSPSYIVLSASNCRHHQSSIIYKLYSYTLRVLTEYRDSTGSTVYETQTYSIKNIKNSYPWYNIIRETRSTRTKIPLLYSIRKCRELSGIYYDFQPFFIFSDRVARSDVFAYLYIGTPSMLSCLGLHCRRFIVPFYAGTW